MATKHSHWRWLIDFLCDYRGQVGRVMAIWIFLVLLTIAGIITDLFGFEIPSWLRSLMWASIVLSAFVASLISFARTRKNTQTATNQQQPDARFKYAHAALQEHLDLGQHMLETDHIDAHQWGHWWSWWAGEAKKRIERFLPHADVVAFLNVWQHTPKPPLKERAGAVIQWLKEKVEGLTPDGLRGSYRWSPEDKPQRKSD